MQNRRTNSRGEQYLTFPYIHFQSCEAFSGFSSSVTSSSLRSFKDKPFRLNFASPPSMEGSPAAAHFARWPLSALGDTRHGPRQHTINTQQQQLLF
jgi:hypothetical protein